MAEEKLNLEISWWQKVPGTGWEKHMKLLEFDSKGERVRLTVPQDAEGVTVRKILNAFPVREIHYAKFNEK